MVEQLGDLLRGPLGALVLGGHPGLGGLLHTFLPMVCTPAASALTVPDAGSTVRLPSRAARRTARRTSSRDSGLRLTRQSGRRSAAARSAPPPARPRSPCPPWTRAARCGRSAWASVSQVSTPKPTGTPVSTLTWVSPSVAAWQTYSKCGVPPRTTTPSATTASWAAASRRAATGSSKVPGTRSTSGGLESGLRQRAAGRPASSPSITSACHCAATTATRNPRDVAELLRVELGVHLRHSYVLMRTASRVRRCRRARRRCRRPRAASWPIRSRLVRR